MRTSLFKRIAVLGGTVGLTVLSAAALAQPPAAVGRGAGQAGQALVLEELATVDFIEKSDVAALREGVIEKMEMRIGSPVKAGAPIGYLHREIAELTVKKSQVLANNEAPEEKAQAQLDMAASVVARNTRLNSRIRGAVSEEDVAKAEAELKFADASVKDAREQRAVNQAELALAEQTLKEHTIVAPFDGIVINLLKNPGESVRANEAVVTLGNLSRLRVFTFVPLEYAYRVKEGQVVEIQPRLTDRGSDPLPIERKRFRGKITFVDPQIQALGERATRVYAEFENPNFELRPGLKVQMTIFLSPQDVAAADAGAGGGVR
jgi:RND family efflux transporter MFP subunit